MRVVLRYALPLPFLFLFSSFVHIYIYIYYRDFATYIRDFRGSQFLDLPCGFVALCAINILFSWSDLGVSAFLWSVYVRSLIVFRILYVLRWRRDRPINFLSMRCATWVMFVMRIVAFTGFALFRYSALFYITVYYAVVFATYPNSPIISFFLPFGLGFLALLAALFLYFRFLNSHVATCSRTCSHLPD